MPKSYARRLEENLLGLGLAAVILTLGAWGASATVLDAGASSSNGLVAEYRFDTGAGNTAYDTSGNNDGNINGASWTGGVKEGSLKFDGSDDFIETGYTEDPSEVSLSAWIKIDQSMQNNYGSIISKYRGDGSSQSYEMLSNDNGGIRFHTSGTKVDSTATLDAGRWYHVVSTWNGDAGKIYINGRLDTSDSSLSPNNNDINWEIGRSPRGDNYFNGKIDNARIYSKPLNHSQIQSLYNSGSWRIGTNTEEDDLSKVLDISFQHQNNTHVYDTSGYENHGIRENGVGQASSVDCKIGRCYSFDGKDDYVDFGDEGSLDVGDNLTISAWIENDEVASYRSLDSNGYTHSQLIGMKWAGGDTDCTSDASFSPGLIRPYNNSEYGRANWDSSSFWRVYDTGKPSVYGDYSEYMIDFDTVWGSDVSNGEAYAGSYIWSPDDRTVDISIGSDDTRKLWVNGRIAHKECDDQGLNVDDSTVKVNIEEGWNSVFAMVNEDSGGWGLQWRISDNANNLRYTADPEIVFDKKDVQISLRDGYLTGFYGNETLAENISTRGWHHAAMKGEGSSFGLYLDGKLVDSGTTTNKPSKNSVGAKSGASLGGKIDQIKVFNRSLSQSEIVEKTQGLDSGGAVLDLQFNRDGGDLAEDGSGKNNHGRLEPNEESGPSRRSGFQGGYLDFDNNDDYVEIQDSSSLDIDNSFTWSVWIKPDSIGSDSTVFGKSNAYELTLRDNDIKIVSWGDDWSPSHQLSENEWHHITVTGKADGSSRTLYVDGQKVAEGGPSYTMDQSNNPLQIGRWPDQDGSGIDGKISRLEILDYRIDQKGVKEMYQAGSTSVQSSTKALPSPVLSQTFNRIETCGRSDTITCPSGASGEIAVDESGEANHGELVNSPVKRGADDCRVGGCLGFDGSDDSVNVGDVGINFDGSQDFSISGWFKTGSNADGTFVELSSDGETNFRINQNSNGDWTLSLEKDGNNDNADTHATDGSWHHGAIIYSGDQGTFYLDGEEDGSFTSSSWAYPGTDVNIGYRTNPNTMPFNGPVDDVRIYNRSLSKQEVWRLYAQGRDRSTSSKGPVLHYPMQTRSSPVADVSGEGNDGDINLLGEIGTFNTSDGEWRTVRFERKYEDPVVVGTSNTLNGESALSFEAKNVDPGSAQVRLCESEGENTEGCDTHGTERASYMVVSASATEDIPGIEAGTLKLDSEIDSRRDTVSYSDSFGSAPNVMANVNTDNGRNPVEARVTSFSTSSFNIGICYQDSTNGCDPSHVTEEVGYVALEPGNLPFEQTAETGRTGNSAGGSNFVEQTFSNTYQDPAVVVSTVSEDGGQETQIDEAANLGPGSVDVRYCEIENGDVCNGHTSENVAWFVAEEGLLTYSSGSSPRYTQTKVGRALSFDGADDSVPVGEPPELTDEFLQDSITMSAHVKPDQCSGTHSILGKSSDASNDNYRIYLESDCSVSVYIDGAGGTITTSKQLETDSWTHITATYNGNERSIYFDGRAVKTTSASGNIADASGSPFALGSRGGDRNFFDGKIAEARLYPYGASKDQVEEIVKGASTVR